MYSYLTKMHFKLSFAKWRQSCLALIVLNRDRNEDNWIHMVKVILRRHVVSMIMYLKFAKAWIISCIPSEKNRKYLDNPTTEKMINCIITSLLDYCNSLLRLSTVEVHCTWVWSIQGYTFQYVSVWHVTVIPTPRWYTILGECSYLQILEALYPQSQ